MSLLMEALRKAEEAKSKAAKEEQEKAEQGEAQATPGKPAPAEPTTEELTADPVPDEFADNPEDSTNDTPVVIEPDPDEADIFASRTNKDDDALADEDAELASSGDTAETSSTASTLALEPLQDDKDHKDQEEQDDGPDTGDVDYGAVAGADSSDSTLEQFELTPEDFERTPATTDFNEPEPEPEPPVVDDIVDELTDEDDNDSLSVLQSSYFTRTPKSSTREEDDALEKHDYNDYETPVDAPAAPGRDPVQQYGGAMDDDTAPDHTATEASSDESSAETARAQELEKRSSAGSLFLAKQQSQRKHLRKILSIAAVLLVVPVAGALYWFYGSFNAGPAVQFNVPQQGGLADRGFLGGDDQPDNTQLGAGQVSSASQTTQANDGQADSTQSSAPDAGETATDTSVATATAAGTEIPATETPDTGTQGPGAPGTQTSTAPAPVASNDIAADQPAPAAIESTATGQTRDVTSAQEPQTSSPANVETAQTPGLTFVRREVVNVVNPDLSAAYDSYQQGDYTSAGRLYQQVLNLEPNNRDAMLGLATVYQKQNNIPMSQNLYVRLLELNPRDPIARAGLLETSLQDDPGRQEAELKSLIAAYPGVAPLSFALGNLYAIQSRWNEAQSAYFNALLTARSANAGPVSPDYAYNLAVSLERLNQLSAALDYYREAAEFSRAAPPGFDINQLNQRINILEQRLP